MRPFVSLRDSPASRNHIGKHKPKDKHQHVSTPCEAYFQLAIFCLVAESTLARTSISFGNSSRVMFKITLCEVNGLTQAESSASWIASTHLYLSQKYSYSNIRVFAWFEFRAVAKAPSAPPSTSPSAPRSSYELAGGSTLKVSGSINGPDQALISLMRHQGQPLRLEPLVWLFYLIQAVSERLFVVLDGFWSSGCIGVQRRSFAGEGRTWLPEILLHMPSSHFFSTTVFSSTRVSPMCNMSPYVHGCRSHLTFSNSELTQDHVLQARIL